MVASDTGIYWNILEILEQAQILENILEKRHFLENILENFQYLTKPILENTGNRIFHSSLLMMCIGIIC